MSDSMNYIQPDPPRRKPVSPWLLVFVVSVYIALMAIVFTQATKHFDPQQQIIYINNPTNKEK